MHRTNWWKGVHDESKTGPEEENDVAEKADWSHPEWTVRDVVAAAEEETDYGDGVGDVEADDAGGDHAGWVIIG